MSEDDAKDKDVKAGPEGAPVPRFTMHVEVNFDAASILAVLLLPPTAIAIATLLLR